MELRFSELSFFVWLMCLVIALSACSGQSSPATPALTDAATLQLPRTAGTSLANTPWPDMTPGRPLSEEELREKWELPFTLSTALVSVYLTAAEAPSELLQPAQVGVSDMPEAQMPLAIILAAIEDLLEPWTPSEDQKLLRVQLQQRIDEGEVTIEQWDQHLTLADMPPLMESLSDSAWETAMSVMQAMIQDGLSEKAIEEMAEEGADWLRSLEQAE